MVCSYDKLSVKIAGVFDALNKRIVDLEQVLDFYAQQENYVATEVVGTDIIPPVQLDHGIRAMGALNRGKK